MAGNGTSGLAALRERIRAAAERLGADEAKLPTYGASDQTGRPHIEADARLPLRGLRARHRVRAHHLRRRGGDRVPGLPRHRVRDGLRAGGGEPVRGQDSRRRIFALELELLRRVDPAWAERVQAENERILAEYPFEERRATVTVRRRNGSIPRESLHRHEAQGADMRSAAIGMVVLALVAAGAPDAAASDKSHDGGFFLRLAIGGGHASTEVDDGLGALELRGPSGSFDVAIGAVVAKNFAVHGTLGGFALSEPTVEFGGSEEDTDDVKRGHEP